MLDLLSILFLPALAFVGLTTSYQDIKFGRINNKWIIFSLAYSFLALSLAVFLLSIQDKAINQDYIIRYFINIAFSLLIGFFIWICNLWSAGDAKLFLAYSALVPLSFYNINLTNYFPSFSILVYTFVPFVVFYTFNILFRTSIKLKIRILKEILKPKFLFDNLMFMFPFSWLGLVFFTKIFSLFPYVYNAFASVIFIFLLFYLFKHILKIEPKKVGITLSIIALAFDHGRIFTLQFLYYFISVLLLFFFIRHFILNLSFQLFSHPIYIEDLKPGMILAENFINKDGAYKKKKIMPVSFLAAITERAEEKFLFPTFSEGLTEKEVTEVKRLHSEGIINDHTIMVSKTVPFAPFIFIGAILTILLKGRLLFL